MRHRRAGTRTFGIKFMNFIKMVKMLPHSLVPKGPLSTAKKVQPKRNWCASAVNLVNASGKTTKTRKLTNSHTKNGNVLHLMILVTPMAEILAAMMVLVKLIIVHRNAITVKIMRSKINRQKLTVKRCDKDR